MCGIFGYIGKNNARQLITAGLKRLEYRGYDSWGVATLRSGKIDILRKVGSIKEKDLLNIQNKAYVGIGHTRWATHGGVAEKNAHPHRSSDGRFALAQNGIVENFQTLKTSIKTSGYKYISETDTEVIVHVIENELRKQKNFVKALRIAFLKLEGRNTIIVLDTVTGNIYGIRNGSPLVLGVGEKEFFLASDTLSFANKTRNIVQINDGELVQLDGENIRKIDVKTGENLPVKIKTIEITESKIDKSGYDHFMIKEIIEQAHTVKNSSQYTLKDLRPLIDAIKSAGKVYTVGAGTAYYAAAQIAYFLRTYSEVDATELKSYEVESYKNLINKGDVVIAVSQSGETADTLSAVDTLKKKGAVISSIVNMAGSTLAQTSTYSFLTRSGPEICVASTKSYTAQLSWGYVLALSVAGKYALGQKEVNLLSKNLSHLFTNKFRELIDTLAEKIVYHKHFFVLGKGQNYITALEAALKVKEISYKHFEGFAAGELKHGVIALVEKGTPVFLIISEDESKKDMLSACAEVKARGAFTIAIAKKNNDLFDYFIKTPDCGKLDSIINIIPFQLLAYYLAIKLNLNPDMPRNLAKSVTVK